MSDKFEETLRPYKQWLIQKMDGMRPHTDTLPIDMVAALICQYEREKEKFKLQYDSETVIPKDDLQMELRLMMMAHSIDPTNELVDNTILMHELLDGEERKSTIDSLGEFEFQKQSHPDTSEFECFFHFTDEKLFCAGFQKGYEMKISQSAYMWIEGDDILCYESGPWDGERSDLIIVQMDNGDYHMGRLYVGHMDSCTFTDFYDQSDREIVGDIKRFAYLKL